MKTEAFWERKQNITKHQLKITQSFFSEEEGCEIVVRTSNEKWHRGSEASNADGVSSVTDFHILHPQRVGQTVLRRGHVKLISSYFLFLCMPDKSKHFRENHLNHAYFPGVQVCLECCMCVLYPSELPSS